MAFHESKRKFQFAAGAFVLLCGILMIAIQLDGWVRLGEKLHIGVAPVFVCLGAMLIVLSYRRKGDKQTPSGSHP
jgi:uncharacterized membrane protein